MDANPQSRVSIGQIRDRRQGFSKSRALAAFFAKTEYSLEEFLGEVIPAEPGVWIVDVSKTRYQFNIGVCQAEHSRITINRVPRDTVAVESTDPDAVLQLVRDLGITGPNTSYIREIQRVLGVAAV